MQVRKLDTSKRRDVRAFVRFPFQLYRDCPQWVPPLLPYMRLALDRLVAGVLSTARIEALSTAGLVGVTASFTRPTPP